MNLALIPEGEAAHIKQNNAIYENRVYIYIDYIYIYIYNKIVIKAVEPAKNILKQV